MQQTVLNSINLANIGQDYLNNKCMCYTSIINLWLLQYSHNIECEWAVGQLSGTTVAPSC